MDKLKPILAHKFWIVFGVALLIPVIGWWMDTSSLKAEIKKRQDSIEGAFKNSTVGSDVPNDKWEADLKKINTTQESQKRMSAQRLYDSQKILTVWPEDVRPMMKDLAFRAPIPQRALDIYRNTYFSEVERVRQSVKPYSPDGNGLVVLPEAAIPYVPRVKWELLPPTPDEMWNAKEDLDLIEGLLKAVNQVNGEAAAINEAAIRQIDTIELMGGTLKAAAAGGGGGGGGGGGPMAGGATTPMGADGAAPVGGFGGGGGRSSVSSSAGFAPSEEFGSQTSSGGGGGGATPAAAAGGTATPMDGAGGGGAAPVTRYVDEDPNMPYRRRAFYMKVIMNHQKVPDLIASLASLPWPVEVVRVQQVAKFDDVSGGGGGVGGALGGAGPGAGPMAAGGGGGFGGGAGPAVDAGFGGRPAPRPMAAGGGVDGDGAGGQANESSKRVYDAAMSDPLLAEVAIAGLMTLYLPPKDTGAPAEVQTPAAEPASPVPADPNAPAAEGTAPASEGTPPAETPTTGDKPAEEKPAAETPATEKPAAPEGTPKPEDASKPAGEPKPPAENKPETGK